MKTIAIFCRSIDSVGHPFKDSYYWSAYLDLLLLLKSKGVRAYFVTDNATYVGGGVFKVAYDADAKVPIDQFHQTPNVKVDLVFEKGGFTGSDVKVLNPEYVRVITASKAQTYKHFAKYQPKSVICEDRTQLEEALRSFKGNLVVVKEPGSMDQVANGGKAVQIGSREQVLAEAPQRYPLIAQEFVDTSVGIENLVEGVHDVRVEIGGGEIWGGTLRTPAPGELKANVAQGGSRRRLYADEIPEEAKRLALEIDKHFSDYIRHYSLDFAYTTDGWKLIELNNNPGLTPLDQSPQGKFVTEKLASYLIEICD